MASAVAALARWYYTRLSRSSTTAYLKGTIDIVTADLSTASATVVPRSEHNISRKNISQSALKVLHRLTEYGHQAYLVGGSVRDLLLETRPKDFDVATSATPEEVRALFRNSRLIGRRFRLVHVRFGREVVEVATFRAGHSADEVSERTTADGRLLSDNVYGTLEEDAMRRDFTVNSLYYDARNFSVLDFAGGLEDLESGQLRLIGDPETRYREDPVRMLRAIRFAAKLDFELSPETGEPIEHLSHLLDDIPAARLFDEVLKLLMSGHGMASLERLRAHDLFRYLFPATDACLAEAPDGVAVRLLSQAMINTDARLAIDKPVTPGFLFAALLWPPVQVEQQRMLEVDDGEPHTLHERAAGSVIASQIQCVSIPRRFSQMARDIWAMQARLERRRRKDAIALIGHPRFRAAYDFLVLRAEAGEPVSELAEWWTEFQTFDPEGREIALKSLPGGGRRRRGPRRRRPRVA